MAFTIDANGITTETQAEIQAQILARLQTKFGGTLNTSITSLSGQFAAVAAELLAVLQQNTALLARSFDPNSATGVLLDQRAALTGSVRKGATYSTIEGLLTATGVCVVPDGTLFENVQFGGQWQTTGGPYNFAGAGSQAATLIAVESGPVNAQAGNTWTPITVIANLTGFTNPAEDATLGETQESDAAFRYRRTNELFARGSGPLLAVQGVVSRVPGVVSCRVYHNPTENPVGTNPNTNLDIPWKAGCVVVETDPAVPGTDLQQAIAEAAWSATGLGVELYGTDYTRTVVDSEGQSHEVSFDVVQEVDCWLLVSVITSDEDEPVIPLSPTEMRRVILTACLNRANALKVPGRDFRPLDYTGAITAAITSGQLSGIASLDIRVSDDGITYGTTPISISLREKADFDSGEFTCVINGVVVL